MFQSGMYSCDVTWQRRLGEDDSMLSSGRLGLDVGSCSIVRRLDPFYNATVHTKSGCIKFFQLSKHVIDESSRGEGSWIHLLLYASDSSYARQEYNIIHLLRHIDSKGW